MVYRINKICTSINEEDKFVNYGMDMVQINDGLTQTAACASAVVYDKANGLTFVSYTVVLYVVIVFLLVCSHSLLCAYYTNSHHYRVAPTLTLAS